MIAQNLRSSIAFRMNRSVFFVFFVFLLFVSNLSFAQYQINGDASQISCNCYQLTPDVQYAGGSVWNVNQINLNNPFNYNFEIFTGCDYWDADGMAFVLQPLNVSQGGISSSLGYGGISPSLAIEVDTWVNDATMTDPQYDHIAIMQNGSTDHASANNLAGPVAAIPSQATTKNCQYHTIQFIWDPALQTLAIFFDGVFRLSYNGNIINTIFGGNSMVFWGWTAGTGSISADQRFCNSILPIYTTTSANNNCAGSPVTFQNASLTSSGNISSYVWNFGDGQTANGAPINHTYAAGGIYNVSMTITTEGCTEDTIIPITIEPLPVVNLGADIGVCAGLSAQLNFPNALGAGPYAWSPATGLNSTTFASPIVTPTATATYTLTYTNSTGCAASDNILVTRHLLPTANAGTDEVSCAGAPVQLQASGGVGYAWTPAASLGNATISNPIATPVVATTYTVTVTDGNNCTAIDQVEVDVLPLPLLDAGPDQNICQGDPVQLNATGVGVIQWSALSAISNTSILNPTTSPNVTTTYYVTLTDGNNCQSIDSLVVDVDVIPLASFAVPTQVCEGNPVQFNSTSSGDVAIYNWDFGDGTTGTGATPAHVYPGLGVYIVSLEVISNNGCSDATTGSAEVIDGPTSGFTILGGTDFCENETIAFQNSSSGPITTYNWVFGAAVPGPTSTSFEPQINYASFGVYIVSLVVGTADQCFDTLTQSLTIHDNPAANFWSTPVCFGENTGFTDLSNVQTGAISGWEWNFGDGAALEYTQNPVHLFTGDGYFTVQLIAQSDEGCRDTTQLQVYVNSTPEVSISGDDVCFGTPVLFSNGTTLNGGVIASYTWQFGNGQQSTGANQQYNYSNHGEYTVQLTAVSDSGCVGVGTTIVTIYPYPQAQFTFGETQVCTPFEASFLNTTTIPVGYTIGNYEWNFGDSVVSSLESPTHSYTENGVFDVSLIATTAGSTCSDTVILADLMEVFRTPTANFTFKPTDASMLDPRIFFNNTSTDATQFSWSFGDDATGNTTNPMHSYGLEGDYEVILTAINGICSSTDTQTVTIDPETFIYIPNSFTPNGNRRNDSFSAKGVGIEQFDMSIYDRWGKLIYHTANISLGWDGSFEGKELPTGTYVYTITILNAKGEESTHVGHVNLLR